jgi:hypothetical protein
LVLRTSFILSLSAPIYSAMHRCNASLQGPSVEVGSTSRNGGGYRAFES